MRSRPALAVGTSILALALTACASVASGGGAAAPDETTEPAVTSKTAGQPEGPDATARERAEEWLDAAHLPPDAVRSEVRIGGFSSFTGWPCGPFEELEAFWTIPDTAVPETANWLMENPSGNLITTASGPFMNDPAIESATVGYIPEPGAQEGIVYTIEKTRDGVAVRAEIAALTESATCQPLPDGGTWGPPGQG